MHDRTLHVVGFALLVTVGFAGATTTGAAIATGPQSIDRDVDVVERGTVSQVNETAEGVTVLDALRMAENETNGTAIAIEQEDVNGISAYDVTVLQANGTYTEVLVDATDPRILTVRPAEDGGEFEERDDDGFFDGLFGDDPEEAVNATNVDLRSAADAVTIASNATYGPEAVPADANVTAVELHRIHGAYVYSVEFETPDEEFEVLVDATPGPVLSVEVDD